MGYEMTITETMGDSDSFDFVNIEGLSVGQQNDILLRARKAIDTRLERNRDLKSRMLVCPICGCDMAVSKDETRTGFLGRSLHYGWSAYCKRCEMFTGYAESEEDLRLVFDGWCRNIRDAMTQNAGGERWAT